MPKRIFITHAATDEPIAKALVRMLQAGTSFTASRVFCSSVEGHGVPTGTQFVEYIHDKLDDSALAIQLVTPAYLDSQFCQWELGATWAFGCETFPFIMNGVDPNDLKGPLALRHVSKLDRPGLNRLHDTVKRVFRLRSSNTTAWEDARKQFLRDLPSLLKRTAGNYREMPGYRRARAERYVDAAAEMHRAMHLLRDAAFVKVRGSGTESLREFMSLVERSVELFGAAFTKLTGSPCRVCIKQADFPDTRSLGPMKVGDLFRSPPGKILRKPSELDFVEGNTDFAVIMKRVRDSFLSNDLIALCKAGGYQNSHWPPDGPPKNPSYVATIVWPIRKILDGPVTFPQSLKPLAEQVHLLGFLCVDSAVTGVFDEEPDISIGAAYADTLYHVMAPWLREKELQLFKRKVG